MDETLIYFGGEIKALGDGRIEGYLIRFGSPTDTDLSGDYFAPDVDIDYYEGKQISLYYNHAMDPVLKNRKIGMGTLQRTEVGYWLQGQLAMRDEYEKAVYGMVESGKVGFSSGSAPHLVERKAQSGASEIKAWPVIEASLTPTPCEKRNMVYPLKSLIPAQGEPAFDIKGLFERELASRSQSVWDLWGVLHNVFREIAKAASTTDVTGVPVNVNQLVSDAVSSFIARLTPAIVEQINDHVSGDSDDAYYVKGLEDQLVRGMLAATREPFANHSETVVSAAQEFAQVADAFAKAMNAYAQRAKDKAEFRAVKDGRMISQANIAKMSAACEQITTAKGHMDSVHSALMALVDAATPKPKEEPAILSAASERLRKLRLEYARTQAASLGVAV